MMKYEITAEMNLKKIISESRGVVQALNEFADKLELIEKKYTKSQESEDKKMKIYMLEDIDKEEISKSVVLLDLFTKTFCRYKNDYERFDDLKFRCDECPFQKDNGECLVKIFKNKYEPDYRDFGSMGNL